MSAAPPEARPVVGCVLVAAGSGSRLGLGIPKALATAGGASLLELAVGTLAVSAPGPPSGPGAAPGRATLDRLVVVVPAAEHATCAALVRRAWAEAGRADDVVVVPGGADRQASVAAGLAALDRAVEVVLVHDAARALAPPSLVTAVADAVRGDVVAVVPGLTPADTVKRLAPAAPHDGEAGTTGARVVAETLDRAGLVAVQTPQGFRADVLRALHAAGPGGTAPGGATDDAGLAEAAGHRVVVVPGHPEAFKVTTALDLVLARALLEQRRTGPGGAG